MKPKLKLSELNHSLSVAHKMLDGKCEWFPFYGSLLGIVRDGSLIDGDDDVDILVHHKNYDLVKSILHDNGFEIDYNQIPNHTPYFFQIIGTYNGVNIRIDFYFYTDSEDDNFIHEAFSYNHSNISFQRITRIPKPLIFPLIELEYMGMTILTPKHSDIICDFIYGADWRKPKEKGVDYKLSIVAGKPVDRSMLIESINIDIIRDELVEFVRQNNRISKKLQNNHRKWYSKLILRIRRRFLKRKAYERVAEIMGIAKHFS